MEKIERRLVEDVRKAFQARKDLKPQDGETNVDKLHHTGDLKQVSFYGV